MGAGLAMIESPKNLPIRPNTAVAGPTSMDLLSYVLAQIRLTGDHLRSCVLARGERLELEAEVAYVCVVSEGALRLGGSDRRPVVIGTGDLVMLPHGAGDLRFAAADAPATIVLCRFRFDADSLPGLVIALPPYIHIGRAQGVGWLEGIVNFLLSEAGDVQPGAALMISRLIDLVVIRTLRSWIHQGPTSGWLGGLADARIASALKAIHERPMQRWSIQALAAIAGMSRSSFCQHFAALVGRSPLRYCNECRLRLARDLLAQRGARVGEIGLSVGYESEAAFSRAYKRLFGHSPRLQRR
jgi:AraC-like DNA-binding protein